MSLNPLFSPAAMSHLPYRSILETVLEPSFPVCPVAPVFPWSRAWSRAARLRPFLGSRGGGDLVLPQFLDAFVKRGDFFSKRSYLNRFLRSPCFTRSFRSAAR